MVAGTYPSVDTPHLGTHIKSQIDSLIEAGLEIEVVCPRPGPAALRYVIAAVQVFLKTITGRYDVVHGHYGLWCLAARCQWTTPVVASFMGSDLFGEISTEGTTTKKSAVTRGLSGWLAHHVDAVILKSAYMQERLPDVDAAIIPNGVDFNRFQPRSRASVRSELGWDNARYYVLFSNDPGKPNKNFALAEAAIHCLEERGIRAELVVAWGLPQTQVVKYIQASNALLLTSKEEGSPNIVKETMACNVPVVSTDVGDVRQVIDHTAGCSVCSHDPSELAMGLERALLHENPTTGRNDITHLDRSVVARRVIDVYDSVIHANAPSARAASESS